MDMHEKLTASTESQRKLTKELGTMQDRYDELLEMLEEAQDELRLMRSRQRPRSSASSHQQAAAFTVPTDSLASELENSLRQEQLSQALGQRRAQSWRVFETAKAAKKAAAKAALSSTTSTSRMSISASGDATGPPSVCDSQLSVCTSDVESQTSEGYSGDLDSLYESNSELGRPGIPGSNDLENALRRLATRRANEINEREFLAREREEQRSRKLSVVQTLAPYRGLGTLFDTSLPSSSPQMANLSTSSLGSGRLPLGMSTPKFSPSPQPTAISAPRVPEADSGLDKASSSANSYGISLGLASLLHTKESPVVGRSLLRATSIPKLNSSGNGRSSVTSLASSDSNGFISLSAKMSPATIQTSSPHPTLATTSTVSALDLNRTWPAWASLSTGNLSSFPPSTSSSSSSASLLWRQKKLPGSGSFEDDSVHSSTKDSSSGVEDVSVSVSLPGSPRKPPIFTPGMTGQGLLQQLRSKGLSLYGLWNRKSGDESEGEGQAPTSVIPSGTNIDGDTKVRGNAVDGSGQEECGDTESPAVESIFPGDTGVLGALANLRRSGNL
ncbi:trafficking kinesin-binding protein 1 [Plakobranchus ocellatus]|uniref:Trafficking kinesin-binding protein 1 n=1 Tax=Plakobranchus ocellatus TaxID=259542 RepID=A0AAV4AFN2_9GAST|nr:trafficking kinesin-binding protein 1 [Plakobranchus ocellatus]